MSILETKDLYFTYPDGDGRRVILDHVNIQFETGQFYSILGASGSGKTTFLSLISGLDKPQSGDVLYRGKSILQKGLNEYRRNHVAIVFQSYNLIPYLNARDNVLVAMGITDNKLAKNKAARALELLAMVGIDERKAKRKITHLSGGEQQRVAIARALSTNVDVIVADEPTGNLDAHTAETIIDVLRSLAHQQQKCVIIVTHSDTVAQKSDKILKLDSETANFESVLPESKA